ncbi:MAG TPA: AMP-binding protein [Acidimicrobiales bacterium]|nr:AMP-binding protein [Acidimicrobiales bacterium]
MNVAMIAEMLAEAAPERVVVGPAKGGLTAEGLLAGARALAGRFAAAGVGKVGFLDLNSEALPLSVLGAGMAGLPFAPLNYRLADERLKAIVARLAPAVIVAGPDTSERVAGIEGISVVDRKEVLSPSGAGQSADLPFVDPESVAVLLFTSGTTGEPKAAVLRHRHVVSYVISTVEFLSAGEDEAQLVSVPPYHIAGVSSILSNLYAGRRIFYLPGFDPEEWVAAVEAERVTQAMVVPTMLGRILDVVEAGGHDVSSLRHLSYGGGRMPVETIERALRVLPGVDFVNAYGLTETSSTIAVLGPQDHRDALASEDPAVRGRLASVGRPLPSVEVEIRSPEGKPLGPGERGEVHVRGEQVAGEYLGRSSLDADGWFPTRDAGWLDADGFLFLDGRLDDVIVRGGENLSPGEIEDTLVSHPAVADAAVVGVPDAEWGEAVAAAVVLRPGAEASAEELQAWVRERLRSTKAPQLIRFFAELPYNETGKLLRRAVREALSP